MEMSTEGSDLMEMRERYYKITIENKMTGEKLEAKCDYAIVHVANKLENGLLQTHTFNPSDDTETDFRMFLSLGRALQDQNFSWIDERVGEIVEETDIIREVK